MSEVKDRLSKALEELSELFSTTVDSIDEPMHENGGSEGMVRSMRRLSDAIYMKVSSLPKDVEHFQISRLNAVLLSQVISGWSTELERVESEYRALADSISAACKDLEKGAEDFQQEKDKVLDLIDELVPELDIKSELTEAERS